MRRQSLLRISILSVAILFSTGCAHRIDVLPVMDEMKRLDLEGTEEFVGEDRSRDGIPELEVVFEKATFDTTTYELALKGCVFLSEPDTQTRQVSTIWIHAGKLRTYYRATKIEDGAQSRDDDEKPPVSDDSSFKVLKARQFLSSGPDGCFDIVINVQSESDHVLFLAPELQIGAGEVTATSSLYAIGALLSMDRPLKD